MPGMMAPVCPCLPGLRLRAADLRLLTSDLRLLTSDFRSTEHDVVEEAGHDAFNLGFHAVGNEFGGDGIEEHGVLPDQEPDVVAQGFTG
jgi:hypothetical protein